VLNSWFSGYDDLCLGCLLPVGLLDLFLGDYYYYYYYYYY
jgi:hypothetical protein